jgi:hypothetical protein
VDAVDVVAPQHVHHDCVGVILRFFAAWIEPPVAFLAELER